jgi:hypothetical protein
MMPTTNFPPRSLSREMDTIMPQQNQRNTADRIMPRMRDHSCSQSSPHPREHAKHSAIRGDEHYSRDSLIAVRAAKHQR